MTTVGMRNLRDVLGCYATGVAVMTTRTQAGEHVGVTVNSFASLSLSPALILFSLARTANILPHFQQAQHFSVNILAHTQESLSNRFARPSNASWEETAYTEGENGCALLADALAHLECSRYAEIDGGDHRTFFGEVTQMHLGRPGDPLLFYRGRYGTYVGSRFDKLPPPEGSLSDFAVTGWG
jgi:3-hydroxy-9,10-secoandrosta-1,3,5(10)-triene-9,17-dione monooxygenase reductase component